MKFQKNIRFTVPVEHPQGTERFLDMLEEETPGAQLHSEMGSHFARMMAGQKKENDHELVKFMAELGGFNPFTSGPFLKVKTDMLDTYGDIAWGIMAKRYAKLQWRIISHVIKHMKDRHRPNVL